MSEEFDPYRKWLGIAPHEQPPHHYRLLGIAPFEDDPDVIENAADRQMAHVRTYQSGRHRDHSQRILNELSAAKVLLLDPARKAAYDAQLHALLFPAEAAPEPELPPAPVPLPPGPPPPRGAAVPPPPMPTPPAPGGRPVPMGQAVPSAGANVAPVPSVSVGTKPRSVSKGRSRKKSSPVPLVVGCIVVGLAVVGIALLVASQNQGSPPDPAPKSTANKLERVEPKRAAPPIRRDDRPRGNDSPRPAAVVPADKKFELAVVTVRDALAQRDLEKAETAIADAAAAQASADDGAEVERLRTLHARLKEFWKAVEEGVSRRMQEGDVLVYDDEVIELVERDQDSGVVKVKYNHDDHSGKLNELPAHMVALFARKGLDTKKPQALLTLATFWTLDGKVVSRTKAQERAKKLWVEAAERGQKDDLLARELGLDAAFVASIEAKPEEEPLPKLTPQEKPQDPPATESQQSRQPLPTMDKLREAKQRFATRYGAQVAQAKNKLPEYEKLMGTLEEDAKKEADAALKYVIYEEAAEAAATVLSHETLLRVLDAMAEQWEIDALRTKQLWLAKARPLSSPAADHFADAAAALAKEAEEAQRLDVAIAAARYSLRVGEKARDRDQKQLARRVLQWEAYADQAAKAKAAEAALATSPDDGNAHLDLGRFLCYFQRDWPAGLAHLAKSNNEEEKALATDDLASPTEATAQAALAERWYQHAKRKAGAARLAALERARHWFEQALAGLEPAAKTSAENRLRDIAKETAPLIGA